MLQVTYSGDGVFISLGLICSTKSSTQAALAENFRSAIYAFSKTSLYAPHSSSSSSSTAPVINAAVYVVAKAWYRSVSVSSSVVLGDSLNNFAQPARPQTFEDVYNGPYFVQKVRRPGLAFAVGHAALLGQQGVAVALSLTWRNSGGGGDCHCRRTMTASHIFPKSGTAASACHETVTTIICQPSMSDTHRIIHFNSQCLAEQSQATHRKP
jgi:hypothetical protein